MDNSVNKKGEIIGANEMLIGNAIPKDFFLTKGTGQSDIAIHSGSFQLAMSAAGIDMCNIINYTSSMLPQIANKIQKPDFIEPGTVLQGVVTICNSRRGQRATAGIKYGWLHDRENDERVSGLLFSNWGYYTIGDIEEMLDESLREVYNSGYEERFYLSDVKTIIESFTPAKTNGTALVALCFVNYIRPVSIK